MKGIIAKQEGTYKISQGCYLHRFFRNKVYMGLDDMPLKRRTFRGKRDKNGKRISEAFYVDETLDFRIEEKLLVESIETIIEQLLELDDIEVSGWNKDAEHSYFEIMHKSFMKKRGIDIDGYKKFMSDSIMLRGKQEYENTKMKIHIRQNDFKSIIEKIEVYETGIVCIFTNGFEMSLQF